MRHFPFRSLVRSFMISSASRRMEACQRNTWSSGWADSTRFNSWIVSWSWHFAVGPSTLSMTYRLDPISSGMLWLCYGGSLFEKSRNVQSVTPATKVRVRASSGWALLVIGHIIMIQHNKTSYHVKNMKSHDITWYRMTISHNCEKIIWAIKFTFFFCLTSPPLFLFQIPSGRPLAIPWMNPPMVKIWWTLFRRGGYHGRYHR